MGGQGCRSCARSGRRGHDGRKRRRRRSLLQRGEAEAPGRRRSGRQQRNPRCIRSLPRRRRRKPASLRREISRADRLRTGREWHGGRRGPCCRLAFCRLGVGLSTDHLQQPGPSRGIHLHSLRPRSASKARLRGEAQRRGLCASDVAGHALLHLRDRPPSCAVLQGRELASLRGEQRAAHSEHLQPRLDKVGRQAHLGRSGVVEFPVDALHGGHRRCQESLGPAGSRARHEGRRICSES
mmetsp:Transcript_67043/g.120716  ORF Transcript_67043/g.120716 Transcript_67043/m.120716 type:complete len:239 (+) Transcript_67043:568-1284(+)